jgi:hypothetical protein
MKDLAHVKIYSLILYILTPRQKPIEAPVQIIASSTTLSKMCASGRYDRYLSFSCNCKQKPKKCRILGMLKIG